MTKIQKISENFLNPPIFLAILEIRYKNSNLKNIEQLSDCIDDSKKLFPNFKRQLIGQLKLENLLEGQPSISLFNQKVDCFVYSSENNMNQFTISLERFNYRQSGKYSGFNNFTKNIKTIWKIHQNLLKNIEIIGISLRYLNKIEIKSQVNDPTEYFNVSIQAEKNVISDAVSNFSIRYITNDFELKSHAIISLSLEPVINNVFPFILDIDVHDENPMTNDLKNLWEKFDILQSEKNKLFNNLITDKTKALFK